MLKLTVTQFDQQHIDIIKYTSIICSYGHAKIDISEDKIIVNIDTDLCQIEELSAAHETARRLQRYGSVRMEREYPRVDHI
jgi:hypothetical protein